MQTILPLIPEGSSNINDILSVVQEEDVWTYYIGVFPVYSHKASDHNHFRLTIAQLVDSGTCRICELISAFGISKNKVLRAVKQLRKRGASSFFEKRNTRKKGTILTPEKLIEAQKLLDRGAERDEVARTLDVKYDTLRKAINDGRLNEPEVKNPCITTLSERSFADDNAASGMGTACTRTADRLFAAVGILNGAPMQFKNALDVLNGGVLCALPALLGNGLLTGLEKLGPVNGYYTAEQVLLVMSFMYLCRIKNVEQLRGYSPGEFGKLVGLDRIPEARCLRGKMDVLAGDHEAEEWAAFLSRMWMEDSSDLAGFLYVDGHVKVYSGKNELPRRFVSRERLCLRGISNYWVNDAIGQPFFVVEKQIDSGLIRVLEEDIVPRLLEEVPGQPSEEELANDKLLHRFVIVFDREGYSPELFRRMWEKHRIACMTYRKNCNDRWPEKEFSKENAIMPRGETVEMKLAERGSALGKNGFWVKEVRKLTETGHQTAIVTTAYRLDRTVVAPCMFTRWCQENFFSYAMHHFPIDELTEYGAEAFSGTEKLVNPQWRELERERNSAKGKLIRRQAKYVSMDSQISADPNHKGYQKWEARKAKLLEEIQLLEADIEDLKEKKKTIPHHITWSQLPEEDKFKRIPSSRRRLVNTVAMIVYRSETAMASLMQSESSSVTSSKARSILQDLFTTPADILPEPEKKRMRIRIHGAATPAVNHELNKLFNHLNNTETIYPFTEMKMVFESIQECPKN